MAADCTHELCMPPVNKRHAPAVDWAVHVNISKTVVERKIQVKNKTLYFKYVEVLARLDNVSYGIEVR